MKRKHNWKVALDLFIEENRHTPFTWGDFDCALFAAKAIEVITGHNYYDQYLGKYTDQETANKRIKEVDQVNGIIELADKYLTRTNTFITGDIVCTDFGIGKNTLGVCLGLVDVFTGKDGLVFYKCNETKNPIRWRV